VGRSDPPWPTPAECYLAALAPVTSISIETSGTVAEAGPEETAKIVATVADSLIAVGALPVTSTLLREFPGCADSDEDPGPQPDRVNDEDLHTRVLPEIERAAIDRRCKVIFE